jgi:hypothetical protein
MFSQYCGNIVGHLISLWMHLRGRPSTRTLRRTAKEEYKLFYQLRVLNECYVEPVDLCRHRRSQSQSSHLFNVSLQGFPQAQECSPDIQLFTPNDITNLRRSPVFCNFVQLQLPAELQTGRPPDAFELLRRTLHKLRPSAKNFGPELESIAVRDDVRSDNAVLRWQAYVRLLQDCGDVDAHVVLDLGDPHACRILARLDPDVGSAAVGLGGNI